MRSKSVKALMLTTLLGVSVAAPSTFAATARSRQRTPAKRTAVHKPQKRGVAKATARTSVKKPVKKTAKRPARKPVQKSRAPQETAIHVQGHENVFRGLDRNDNGFISPAEWPGSKMAFDAVDKNDDGRISLSELRSRED
jgi:hypothetical protein